MRQTNAAVPINLFKYFYGYWHTCIALRVLRCTTQFVTLLSLLMLSFGQLLVSFSPLHSLRPSFRYHYTSFAAITLLHFMASHLQVHKANTRREAHFISQYLRYNTHRVPLSLHYVLHSFQSGSVHPLPIILRALLACPSCGFVMVFDLTHKALTKIKNTRQTLAFLVAVKRRFTAFLPPLGQAHAATSIRTSFQCLLTARYAFMLQCGQVCHTALASFCRRRYYLFAIAQGRKNQGRKTREIKYGKKINTREEVSLVHSLQKQS